METKKMNGIEVDQFWTKDKYVRRVIGFYENTSVQYREYHKDGFVRDGMLLPSSLKRWGSLIEKEKAYKIVPNINDLDAKLNIENSIRNNQLREALKEEPCFVEFEPTERGFERGEFIDLYGHKCSIQDSSLATERAIWLGINDAAPQRCIPGQGWTDVEFPDDTLFHTRMHLNQKQAIALIEVLQRFVDTGSISEEENGS